MGRYLLILCLFVFIVILGYFALVFLQGVFSSKGKFKEGDVVFYKGKHWIIISVFFHNTLDQQSEVNLMGVEDASNIISVTYDELRRRGILQQDHLEAQMKSEAFTEVYSDDNGLTEKYGKKKK
jgi:hypothetical protein